MFRGVYSLAFRIYHTQNLGASNGVFYRSLAQKPQDLKINECLPCQKRHIQSSQDIAQFLRSFEM